MNGWQVVKEDAGQAQQDKARQEEADQAFCHAGDYTAGSLITKIRG